MEKGAFIHPLEKALEIALAARRGQVDKAGKLYILYPLRVMIKQHDEWVWRWLKEEVTDGK